MERPDGKTTIWVPKEAFSSVQRFWKPEFNWVPVPVDRSLPPGQIAYIETDNGPVSPLPPPPRTPKTPLVPKTPRTPLDLPPLETASLPPRTALSRQPQTGYFDDSPELETAITRGFSPANTDGPATPSTATEPESPNTPKDLPTPETVRSLKGASTTNLSLPKLSPAPRPTLPRPSAKPKTKPQPALPRPSLWEHSRPSYEELHSEIYQRWAQGFPGFPGFQRDEQQAEQAGQVQTPWKIVQDDVKWRMVDQRHRYRPKDNLRPASWSTMNGPRDLKMNDKWSTFRRDEAHWNGSKKGFAVRLDMHLNVEVQLKGSVNGDITLSAEALYVSTLSFVCKQEAFAECAC